MMKEKKIMLPSVEEAKHFVAEASKCDFDIDVFYIASQLMQNPF